MGIALFIVMVGFIIFCIVVGYMFDENKTSTYTTYNNAKNTITTYYKDKGDPLFIDIINIVRHISDECYSFDKNSCEELAFSIELFILFISYIIVYICKTNAEQQKLINIYVMVILEYISKNRDNISYTEESVLQSFLSNYYTRSILTENFISRYKKYEPYLKIYVKDSANITEQEMFIYVDKMVGISSTLKTYLYDIISPKHKDDMFEIIILEKYNTIQIIDVVRNIRRLSLDMLKDFGINVIKEIEQPHEGY